MIAKTPSDRVRILSELKDDPDKVALMGQEIHGISSSGKPWSGWVAQAAIQECREACGGHGYLKGARFGELRYL